MPPIIVDRPGNVQFQLLPDQEPHAVNDAILYSLRTWLSDQARVAVMKDAATFKGGWEGWVQVELAIELMRRNPNLLVKREERVYFSDDRVDLWLRDGNLSNTGIEIKCRNANTEDITNNTTSLSALMMQDVVKVEGNVRVETHQQVPLPRSMYAMAITGNPNDLIQYARVNLGMWGEYPWKTRQNIKWCYLRQAQIQGVANDVTRDLDRVRQVQTGQIPTYENLYLIWFKR